MMIIPAVSREGMDARSRGEDVWAAEEDIDRKEMTQTM
jgi:hypothetical protein